MTTGDRCAYLVSIVTDRLESPMAKPGRPSVVALIHKALANGPMPADDLLSAIHQAGLRRIDTGALWEICATHGLADLRDGMWVPRGWARPHAPQSASRPSVEEERAIAEARRLAMSLGLPAHEPVPPTGPMSPDWPEAARRAALALRHELTAVSKRRVQTDVPLIAVAGPAAPGSRLRRFEAQGEINAAEGTSAILLVGHQQFQVEIVSVFGSVVTLSVPPETPPVTEATLRARAGRPPSPRSSPGPAGGGRCPALRAHPRFQRDRR